MKSGRLYKLAVVTGVCMVIIALNISMFNVIPAFRGGSEEYIIGGTLLVEDEEAFANMEKQYIKPDDNYVERFLRPSEEEPFEKKYSYDGTGEKPAVFKMPADAARAYFDVLSDASNLDEKKGGCGSIGQGKSPYPAAYALLSGELKNTMTLEKFIKSFEGIGHINLMKLVDVPSVKIGTSIYPRVFVEIETIEGSDVQGKTYFAYYYGYIRMAEDNACGWKISNISLKPEDFLCHAYHGWWHDAGTIVDIVYNQKCGIIDKILGVEEGDDFRSVLAKGRDGKQYRFIFARLTNGADIELRQYVMEDGKWKDIYIDTSGCNK